MLFIRPLIPYESKICWHGKLSTSPRLQRSQIWSGTLIRQARNHYASINGRAVRLQMKVCSSNVDKERSRAEKIVVNNRSCFADERNRVTVILVTDIISTSR
jgi:hypothetical protein